jgi:hypothetical protein
MFIPDLGSTVINNVQMVLMIRAFITEGMYKRCEKVKGKGNCEKWGAVVYSKCKSAYENFGC